MPLPIQLHLRDLSRALVAAWRQEFTGIPGVSISQGDIFSERSGPVSAGDPIDIRADAVVSPANSFGFMDGGIDLVYTYQQRCARQMKEAWVRTLLARPSIPYSIREAAEEDWNLRK